MKARAEPPQFRQMFAVLGIVDETAEMDGVPDGKRLQPVKRADLVALVGWEGNSVNEQQDLHAGLSQSARDWRTQEVRQRKGQPLPHADQQSVFWVERIDLRQFAASQQQVLVVQRPGCKA